MSLLIQAQCFSTNLQLPFYTHLEIRNLHESIIKVNQDSQPH